MGVYRRRASRWKAKMEQRSLGRSLLVHLRTAKGPVAGAEWGWVGRNRRVGKGNGGGQSR